MNTSGPESTNPEQLSIKSHNDGAQLEKLFEIDKQNFRHGFNLNNNSIYLY